MGDSTQFYDEDISTVFAAGGAEGYTAGSLDSWLGNRRMVDQSDEDNTGPTGGGPQEWVFIKATAAIQQYELCRRTAATLTRVHDCMPAGSGTSLTAGLIAGAAQHDIASGSYGWIVRNGPALCFGNAATNAGDPIASGGTAAGDFRAMAGGEENDVIGVDLDGLATSATVAGSILLTLP